MTTGTPKKYTLILLLLLCCMHACVREGKVAAAVKAAEGKMKRVREREERSGLREKERRVIAPSLRVPGTTSHSRSSNSRIRLLAAERKGVAEASR